MNASCLPRRGLATRARSLYDVLGVTPRASSKQIKVAYFRLSKEHHPDRRSGQAAAFQEISAAYEVLGNRQRRRAYDQEVAVGDGAGSRPEWAPKSSRGAPPTGRTAHFNYDVWAQSHYADVRERESKSRAEYKITAEKRSERREERLRGFLGCALLLVAAGYMRLIKDNDHAPLPQPMSRKSSR